MIAGVYLHLPFCARRCLYCDFNTYEGLSDLLPSYTRSLLQDIETAAPDDDGRGLVSVFFGGGTPSLLAPSAVAALMKAVGHAFPKAGALEVSLEANPGTVDQAKLEGYRASGVNRLSLGVQAVQDGLLAVLGRIHSRAEAAEAVRLARRAGFGNINVDLMFGLPGQTLEQWKESLAWVVEQGVEHVSFYGLNVELATPFGRLQAEGRLPLPEEDLQAEMYEFGRGFLEARGLAQYEISNFARPGRECRHNRLYWENRDTLGVGAGAWSYVDGERWMRPRNPKAYMDAVSGHESLKAESQRLTGKAARGEAAYLALRMSQGIDLQAWKARYGVDLTTDFGAEMRILLQKGQIGLDEKRIFIRPEKRIVANDIFSAFWFDQKND